MGVWVGAGARGTTRLVRLVVQGGEAYREAYLR